MKTLTTLFISFFICTGGQDAFANDEKYLELMQKNIQAIYAARDIPAFQQAVNSFERIASVEKTKWEPLYYIAYGNIMMANFEKDGSAKDSYLDVALEHVSKAKSLAPREPELIVLEGFIAMMRVTVDPQSRGPVHAPVAMQHFGKALELEPANPRALALMAQMQFGTARFFNSPTTEACELNKKAIQAFESATTENSIAPAWGVNMAKSLLDQCK